MIRSLAVLAILAVAALPTDAQADNLLVNPGFEASGGSLDGWESSGDVTILDATAGGVAHTGIASVRMTGNYYSSLPNGSGIFQVFPATPGRLYRLSGWVYPPTGPDSLRSSHACGYNFVRVQILFRDAPEDQGAIILRHQPVVATGLTPAGEWTPFAVTLPAPPSAQSIRVAVSYTQEDLYPGAGYVDDLSLLELDPTPLPNLLVNSDFSAGLTGWDVVGTVEHEASSNYLVRSVGGSAWVYSVGPASLLSQTISASPGSTYRLEFHLQPDCTWYWATLYDHPESTLATASLEFLDGTGGSLGVVEEVVVTSASPVNTWLESTVTAPDAPAGTESVRAGIRVQSQDGHVARLWVDDASVSAIAAGSTPTSPVDPGPLLSRNVPNPFRTSTRIAFDLPAPTEANLRVYDVTGRRVATLVSGTLVTGPHEVTWDGRSEAGDRLPAGTYWYRLETEAGWTSRGMLLLDR